MKIAQTVFDACVSSGMMPAQYVKEQGLAAASYSEEELDACVARIIAAHPQEVAQYRSGKTKLFGFFVGKAMAETKGGADPVLLNKKLQAALQAV